MAQILMAKIVRRLQLAFQEKTKANVHWTLAFSRCHPLRKLISAYA
jgi:hypothetical protein